MIQSQTESPAYSSMIPLAAERVRSRLSGILVLELAAIKLAVAQTPSCHLLQIPLLIVLRQARG